MPNEPIQALIDAAQRVVDETAPQETPDDEPPLRTEPSREAVDALAEALDDAHVDDAATIRAVLDNVWQRLMRKRSVYQYCVGVEYAPSLRIKHKADGIWEAIKTVDRFRKHYANDDDHDAP